MYRPKNWDNPYAPTYHCICLETDEEYDRPHPDFNTFEAGADAMLEGILKLIENEQLVPKRVADDIKIYMGLPEEKKDDD